MRLSPAETRSLPLLRTLTLKEGFDVERSGALAFTLAEAKTYLLTLPDA